MRMATANGLRGALPVAAGLCVLAGAATARAQTACMDCHEDRIDAGKLRASAHGKLASDGDLTTACVGCHGIFRVTDEGHAKPPKVDCAKCHTSTVARLEKSVHGAEGLSCTDGHGTHEMARIATDPAGAGRRARAMCGTCHEKPMAEYADSQHGRAEGEHVATCIACHGGHDVRKTSDPESPLNRLHVAEVCARCHANPAAAEFSAQQVQTVKDYFGSVHGLAISKAGLEVSATCTDCHGSHSVRAAKDGKTTRAAIPGTCGKCHKGVLAVYLDSVHGEPFQKGNVDVPVCTDCHQTHKIQSHYEAQSSTYATNIAKTCLRCHADAKYVSQYSFPGLRVETYLESYHGAASRLGDTRVAHCASCHGSHDIRASTDPKSSTNPANMNQTCGSCHSVEDPSRPLTLGKIHVSLAEDRHWTSRIVERIYIVLIACTLGFFGFYIVLDLARNVRMRRRARKSGGHG